MGRNRRRRYYEQTVTEKVLKTLHYLFNALGIMILLGGLYWTIAVSNRPWLSAKWPVMTMLGGIAVGMFGLWLDPMHGLNPRILANGIGIGAVIFALICSPELHVGYTLALIGFGIAIAIVGNIWLPDRSYHDRRVYLSR